MKKYITFLLALVLSFNIFLPAYAANITMGPGADEFIFNPTSKDLFEDFKNMMPGDTRSQKIALQNTTSNVKKTVYMRAEVPAKDKDFLRWFKISVYFSKNMTSDGRLLSSNAASVEGDLVKDVLLDTLTPGETTYITVKIECDKQMSNDYASKIGAIHWIFSVEDEEITKPTTATTKPVPTTTTTTKPTTTTTRPSTTTTTRPAATTAQEITTTEAPTTETVTAKIDEPTPSTGSTKTFVPLVTLLLASIIVILAKKRKDEKIYEA